MVSGEEADHTNRVDRIREDESQCVPPQQPRAKAQQEARARSVSARREGCHDDGVAFASTEAKR